MPLAYWCVLVAAILPLAIVVYAKAGGNGDNHHPRDSAERLPPARRRAYAAHLNAYENSPFFAAAVIVANTQGAPLGTLNALAATYIVLRIAHTALYIGDGLSAPAAVAIQRPAGFRAAEYGIMVTVWNWQRGQRSSGICGIDQFRRSKPPTDFESVPL